MTSLMMEMSTEERHKILVEWNRTKSDYPYNKTLPELFEEQVENFSDNTALIFQTEVISYGELNTRANQIARYLRAIGVDNKTLVAICMEPSLDLITSILAILKAGGAYVPLDPSNPAERQRFILEDTQTKVLITNSRSTNNLNEVNPNIHLIKLDIQKSQLGNYSTANLTKMNQPTDLAYVIYTSGSTGTPKGVMISHQNVHNFIHWYSKALAVTSEDIFDFSSSISFDFAVANTLFPIMQGAKIAICPETIKRDPYLYLNHLIEKQISVIKTTPSHFRQLKEIVLSEDKYLSLKYIVFGGETLFAKDISHWIAKFPTQTMFCEYGPTEATVASSWIKVNKNNINKFKKKIPIGKPALNTKLYILDGDLQPVPVGIIGELYIGGDGVAKGYLHREEITRKKFIRDPFSNNPTHKLYKTGDYCRYLTDGNIEFIERIDNQVKIRGYRIELEEIENCLTSHPRIKEAAVIARQFHDDQLTEKQLVAYYVSKNGLKLDLHELRQYLHTHLPDYMVPTFIESLSVLPLSANGKLNRQELPAPQVMLHREENEPCTELERMLKTIWQETLKITHISIEDNFFDLGGHSLSAARIISKIKKTIKKEIKLQDFYHAPTIKGLANLINQTNTTAETHVVKNQTKAITSNTIPLSELQFLFWLMKLFYPKAKILNIIDRKRVQGWLDIPALNFALACVCKKYPVFSYHIAHYFPSQVQQKLQSPQITETDIRHLSPEQQEITLINSLDYLQKRSWKKGQHLLEVRLFYLSDDTSEVQISMSHFISDEIASGILFADLSRYYLSYHNNKNLLISADPYQYKDYILQNISNIKTNFNKDIEFWETYLQDAPTLSFPEKFVIRQRATYCTTYITIPDAILDRLQSFCTANRLSITDSLCAAVGFCLSQYLKDNKTVILNFVKSTRDNENYDKTIGLFVRTDLIKVNVNDSPNFIELSKRVQTSIAETSPHQTCPIIVKIACLLMKNWKNKKISNFIAGFFTRVYAGIFSKYKLDHRILMMFIRVFLAKKKDNFFVDVNIMNNFIEKSRETNLFGHNLQVVKSYQGENAVDRNILNIWFDRDSENKTNLILSGNLQLPFLETIGQNIIEIISRTAFP